MELTNGQLKALAEWLGKKWDGDWERCRDGLQSWLIRSEGQDAIMSRLIGDWVGVDLSPDFYRHGTICELRGENVKVFEIGDTRQEALISAVLDMLEKK